MRKPIISAEDSTELAEEFQKWFWLKHSTGDIYEYSGGSWVVTGTFLKVVGGNTDIPGTSEANKGEFAVLEVNGQVGIDKEVVIGAETFKFKGGVLYEVV